MTLEQMLSGAWFQLRGTNNGGHKKLYKFIPQRHNLTGLNPGFLVENSTVANTTHFHCDVYSVENDGTLKVYAFLLGEMMERTLDLNLFEIAPEN